MHSIPGTVATAAGAFAATNVDLFVLLTVLFATARASGTRAWRVMVAQCLVFVILVVTSAAAATALTFVALRWVGLLGVVPLAIGIHGLVTARRKDEHDPRVADSITAIVTLTLSVCADNLSVYIVLFRAGSRTDFAVTVGVFALLQATWALVAYTVATRKTVVQAMRRTRIWLVPTIFVAIGLAITVRTGLFG
jgi:cadmium resistance protein CadD (predicted permease)